LDPYQGTLGCLSEGVRNVTCTGADPIGIVDHLQFASPADPEVFWTFQQAVEAIVDYCKFIEIPVVGGKVSFYNETSKGPIKPTPVIGTLGLVNGTRYLQNSGLSMDDTIFIVGATRPEMGGSEYFEYVHKITGGTVPVVDLQTDKKNSAAVLAAIREGLVSCAHDCSKGGLGVALAEMAALGEIGFTADVGSISASCKRMDELLFSESNSRYLLGTKDPEKLEELLASRATNFARIGQAGGKYVTIKNGKRSVARLSLSRVRTQFYSLEKTMS
jgi:phosphoribosylformylglycinamidine synthase